MNFKIILIGCICFLILSSCNKPKGGNVETAIIENIDYKQINGELAIKGDDDLTISFDILIVDSLCVLIDFSNNGKIFRCYKLNDFNHKMFFGDRGQGPNEYLTPLFFKSINKNSFCVFDLNLSKITEFGVTDHDSLKIISEKNIPNLMYSSNLNQIGKDIYIGTKFNETAEGLYFKYDFSQDTLAWIDYSTKFDKYIEINKYELYYNTLCVNKDHNLIVCALRYFNKVLFFDLDGNKVKEIQIGDKEFFPEWDKENNAVAPSSLMYFLDMCITKDYIYCLWLDLVEQNNEFKHQSSKVFVFNWDMELTTSLQLDMPIGRIAVSNDDSLLLGLVDDGTGLTDVIKYDIADILKKNNRLKE
jgi:hypothetical protein